MKSNSIASFSGSLLLAAHLTVEGAVTLAEFQAKAARFNALITLPEFEKTPRSITNAVEKAMAGANFDLNQIGALPRDQVTFASTILALDDLQFEISLIANRLELLKETNPNAALREAATEMLKLLEEWSVGVEYREDVYRVVQTFAETKPTLKDEEAKLLDETLRDYKRAGLPLPKSQRDEIEKLRKQLTGLTTDFQKNITQIQRPVKFNRAELEGVPESFLSQKGVKTGPDEYIVLANVTFHYLAVLENARSEATRRKLLEIRFSLAKEANVPLLQQICELRDKIARQLGYASWADYQIEPKMAKTAAAARQFLENLKTGLNERFAAELAEYRALKAKETGQGDAQIHLWDTAYYGNQLKKTKYNVDAEQLRVFFPYDKVLEGMFSLCQKIFRLRFERVEPPHKWTEDLLLYAVSDAATGEPLGLFYLDMFPREGKYNHFAQFGLVEGKQLRDGKYQRPVVALVCNFPPPRPGQPSLLSHNEVETLFHEFGHAMHSILTRARFVRFSGTSVPRDFVEAPSQMLENWVWEKSVLDNFAADYRDPSKKIPPEILGQLKDAKLATIATFYRRQLSFGLLDLALHSQVKEGPGPDVVQLSNRLLSEIFLPVSDGTAFVAYFGHLMHYDAGYYGYAWADAISADLATVFEKAPQGYYDQQAGLRLRTEIYEPGDSRDVEVSIRRFLGRERSLQPFLRQIGIGK